jgi:hypothetical protein
MRVRIIKNPAVSSIDGIHLGYLKVGIQYELGHVIATFLLAEGWAEPVDGTAVDDRRISCSASTKAFRGVQQQSVEQRPSADDKPRPSEIASTSGAVDWPFCENLVKVLPAPTRACCRWVLETATRLPQVRLWKTCLEGFTTVALVLSLPSVPTRLGRSRVVKPSRLFDRAHAPSKWKPDNDLRRFLYDKW